MNTIHVHPRCRYDTRASSSSAALNNRVQIASAELAVAVNGTELTLGPEPIDVRDLAARLREYDIRPCLLRHGNEVFRGYRRADFEDAFSRYVPTALATTATVTTGTC
jgi:hypothetical protein